MKMVKLFLVLALILIPLEVQAGRIKYQDTVQTKTGQAVSGAAVEVVLTGTATAATLYTTATETTQKTSVTSNSNGLYWFYIDEGRYDLTISKTGMTTQTKTDVPIGVATDLDHTVAGLTSSATVTSTLFSSSTFSLNHAVCFKANGQMGYCTTVTAADGTCTCQ